MLSGTKSSATTRASGLIRGDGPGTLWAEEAHWCGLQSALMHRLDGRWARGSDRSQWALAEVRPQWQLAAVRTFILTQQESELSKNVWEVWQRSVAAPWLNDNYLPTSTSGCVWVRGSSTSQEDYDVISVSLWSTIQEFGLDPTNSIFTLQLLFLGHQRRLQLQLKPANVCHICLMKDPND